MTRIARITVAAAVSLAALATVAQAQLAGIPVYYHPRGGTGVGVAADLGFPDNNSGSGTAYGVSGSFGTGPVTLTAMVGAWKATSSAYSWPSAQTSFGGNISYRLVGGGLLPVAIAVQAGYGMIKSPSLPLVPSTTMTTIPVGVGISIDPPLFPLKPWIAPRMDFISGGGSSTSKFRISGGVNFNLLLGLGVHAAVDYTPSNPSSMILGVGAHFDFHVPMM
jgi:hypothetical protein